MAHGRRRKKHIQSANDEQGTLSIIPIFYLYLLSLEHFNDMIGLGVTV